MKKIRVLHLKEDQLEDTLNKIHDKGNYYVKHISKNNDGTFLLIAALYTAKGKDARQEQQV